MLTLYEKIDLTVKVIGGITALILFFVGLIRYHKDQIWKRKEFISKEVKDFFEDHTIHNCLLMLDWGTRYIELYPNNPDYSKRFVKVGRVEVTIALIPHGKLKQTYSRDESLIRDNFDYFFDRISRFEHFIQAGLFESNELTPYLYYWVKTIAIDLPEPLRSTLHHYVKHYEYKDVITFISRFGRRIEPNFTLSEIIFKIDNESH